ncbi:aldo/keto reductase [Nonomuraea deserti]|uniref:aldo/keto reductase n=1 Tax=Nonomuraea deserti TaxID=1848322 RepID=UPI0024826A34|nr:aldo/keto reductase [Nonomuraea deserti]
MAPGRHDRHALRLRCHAARQARGDGSARGSRRCPRRPPRAVDLGITHIDTADAYGPRVTNELIREALHPYPSSLHVLTKVGAVRDEQGGWPPAREPDQLRHAIDENLEGLGLDTLDLVHLRLGNAEGPRAGRLPVPSRRWSSCSSRA